MDEAKHCFLDWAHPAQSSWEAEDELAHEGRRITEQEDLSHVVQQRSPGSMLVQAQLQEPPRSPDEGQR